MSYVFDSRWKGTWLVPFFVNSFKEAKHMRFFVMSFSFLFPFTCAMSTESDPIKFNLMYGFRGFFFFETTGGQMLIFFFLFGFWTSPYYKRLALQIIESIIHFKAQKG